MTIKAVDRTIRSKDNNCAVWFVRTLPYPLREVLYQLEHVGAPHSPVCYLMISLELDGLISSMALVLCLRNGVFLFFIFHQM